MNERIQQLAIEATEYVDVPMPHEIYNLGEGVFRKILTFNQEKFAELIVRECAGVVKYYHTRNETVTPQQILQHFGVSE
jgi:hypothetical protein